MLREILDNPRSPLLQFVIKERLEALLVEEGQIPWYGQLMTISQTIAYFIQMNMWLVHYKIEFKGSESNR